MPALVAGIHVLITEDVDGRVKPGHDKEANPAGSARAISSS
jgi:hypothetical protein